MPLADGEAQDIQAIRITNKKSMNMKHLISSRTAFCLCGLTLCFNASAQGYVSYNHDAAKMNQITVQEIGSGGLTTAFYYDALHNSYQKTAAKKNKQNQSPEP